jgi:lipopolysaccharide export system protein LptA
MTADGAVVWLTPVRGALLEEQSAQIALVGNAVIDQQGQVQRSGDRLLVTATVRGVIRVTADRRNLGRSEQAPLYQAAKALRPPAEGATGPELDAWLTAPPIPSTLPAATQPTTRPARATQPVAFSADRIDTQLTPDGTVALVITGNVKLFQRRSEAETMEMQADRAVLFTPLGNLRELDAGNKYTKVEDAIVAAYLEGDVRIVHTPGGKAPDQRLTANRVYYDFETDRAILTDAVIQSVEPQRNIPIIVRARTVRQLSLGEYRAEKVKLTQSSFHTPSYAIGMRQAYIRQVDTGDPRYGTLVDFVGRGTTLDLFGTSAFYWPVISGSFTERGGALRNIELEQSKKFGTGLKTDWGLFELMGRLPPPDVDSTLSLDYFHERGPAAGLDGRYGGGFVTEQTRQPWTFNGKWQAYVVNDHGLDDIARKRIDVEPDQNIRYRLNWEHQHFFPDNWQVQLTGAVISDAAFQEEWFRSDFERQRPLDTALYIKHQDQSEAYTFLYSVQPNDIVTAATLVQEQTEVERVPEISYHRIGEVVGDDGPTFFSDNSVGGYRFQGSNAPVYVPIPEGIVLTDDQETELVRRRQGFRATDSPGLPSYGRTGTPTRVTYRGDFRQELDYPVSLGQFRFVPYVVGRYTWYSQSPDPGESSNDRLFAGAGVRVTTAFWRVDDTAQSDLWDIHRLRHVVEPEVNVFTSAQSTGREHLLEYDEPIDEVNDISALQLALRQRWQTKRGGAGRWRSVDFLTLNLEANFFTNAPLDDQLAPVAFRGLYFNSLPEASVPRNSVNADLVWRMSDTTAVLADAQYSLDENILATASIGLAASRGDRLSYFVGVRYIDSGVFAPQTAAGTFDPRDLHSVVATVAFNYELTPKYTLAGRQSFDFGERERVLTQYSLIRHFDRWYASITLRTDYIGEDSGVFFNVWPEGLGTAASASERLQEVFR